MQTPVIPDYSALTKLWALWLQQDQWPQLDKWLKQYERVLAPSARSIKVPKRYTSLQSSAMDSNSFAMISAIRFLQLAAGLELLYRAGNVDIDLFAWDASWNLDALEKIPPLAFWYWIGLRVSTSVDAIAPPKALNDAQKRKNFFMTMTTNTGLQESGLWNGLRPQWLTLLQQRQIASQWDPVMLTRFMSYQTTTPPLWLRVQQGRAVEEVAATLSSEGVNVRLHEEGLCAFGGVGVQTTSMYRQGVVEIQDLASQQIAAAIAVRSGEKVWDCCAGAGGKSLAIAARMNNKGVLLATDLHGYKLDELKRRAKRAQLGNVRTFTWAGDEPLRLPKEIAQQKGFDWVLVDAPCSSSGTWRRNPDARWRFAPTDTAELVVLQQKILHNSAVAVRVGGHLVYATCSWQVSENEAQIALFLQNNPVFSLISQTILGAPQIDADTMFVAVLKRS